MSLIGGIGLFLLGMAMLTGGLKMVAGDGLRAILDRFTRSAFCPSNQGLKGPLFSMLAARQISVSEIDTALEAIRALRRMRQSALKMRQRLALVLAAEPAHDGQEKDEASQDKASQGG